MIGRTISHYEILEKLGEGGMGVVYKARDQRLNRIVAVKFLPENLLQFTDALERFQQEAEAISALNHPHIATIFEMDDIEGQSSSFSNTSGAERSSLRSKPFTSPARNFH